VGERTARRAIGALAVVLAGLLVAIGVGDQDEDSATVLVAANSTVTNSDTGGEGQVRYYRLRMRLVREGDRWLTSDVEFVR
jgi:Mce-associated membrane protein